MWRRLRVAWASEYACACHPELGARFSKGLSAMAETEHPKPQTPVVMQFAIGFGVGVGVFILAGLIGLVGLGSGFTIWVGVFFGIWAVTFVVIRFRWYAAIVGAATSLLAFRLIYKLLFGF
jgi:hypothetical protein